MPFEKNHKKFGGRRKGSKNKYSPDAIQKAFDKEKKNFHTPECATNKEPLAKCNCRGVSFLEHLAKRVRVNDILALGMMKFMAPALKQVDIVSLITDVAADTKEAEEIRKLFLERFGGDKNNNEGSDSIAV